LPDNRLNRPHTLGRDLNVPTPLIELITKAHTRARAQDRTKEKKRKEKKRKEKKRKEKKRKEKKRKEKEKEKRSAWRRQCRYATTATNINTVPRGLTRARRIALRDREKTKRATDGAAPDKRDELSDSVLV
jgi:FKBP-type peptidyl-prolyl cis-trans isomerase